MRRGFAFAITLLFSSALSSHLVEEMSIEEKVGQILMVHVRAKEVNSDCIKLFRDLKIGAVIYYNWANGLESKEQVSSLSLGLSQLAMESSKIPLLIAADQEGGIVARLSDGFTAFPGNLALGMTKDPKLAKECAYAMGKEMRAAGVNMNLAPVVDVNDNPKNPIIGIRSYGDTPSVVITFGKKALRGYKKAKVISCLKHFPGHGDVSVDSHLELPALYKSKEELWKTELLPFSKLSKYADSIMTAHILVPALDPVHCATLSPKILGLLRNEIGFDGVIISDSLVMDGVLKGCSSVDEAALLAFNAGCDLLLLGGKALHENRDDLELTAQDVERIYHKLIRDVKSGKISEKQLDQSVERILKLKEKISNKPSKEIDAELMQKHLDLSKKIAIEAIKAVRLKPLSSAFQRKDFAIIAPKSAAVGIQSSPYAKSASSICFFDPMNPSEDEVKEAKEIAKKTNALIVFSYNAWKTKSQEQLIESLFRFNKPIVLIALRDPLDGKLFPDAEAIIMTYSPTASSVASALEELQLLIQQTP